MSSAGPTGLLARPLSSPAAGLVAASLVLLGVAAVALSRVSAAAFIGAGLAILAVVGYAATRWPRAVLVGVMLSPILDRYLIAGLIPSELAATTHYLSEGLLLTAAAVLSLQGWRSGTLVPALRHPSVLALAAFVALLALSATINDVPPLQAGVGIGFTVDAAVLFVLVRVVGFRTPQALSAVAVFLTVILAAAMVAMAQAVLSPEVLGLRVLTGRFGEVYRLASFFGDPNAFGAFLAAAVPFTLFGVTRLPTRTGRRVALALSFLLLVALWLSFSRGSWLALLLGWVIVGAVVDIRALRIGLLLMIVAFGMALVMPRDLLGPPAGGAGEERPDLIGSTIGRLDTVGQGRDLRTLFVLNAVPIVADHPLLGVGPGRYGGAAANLFGTPVYAEYGTDRLLTAETQRTVDNFWLHLGVESGLLGTAAFAAAIGVVFFPLLVAARRAAGRRGVLLAGICGSIGVLTVDSGTTMLLEANSVGFVYWFLLGIGSLELATSHHLPQRAQDDPQVEPE